MKTLLPCALALPVAAFTAAALAHAAGLITFNVLTPAGIAGALLMTALLAFAGADYRRKRALRVRRSATAPDPRPAGPGPDWTYTTRVR